jgi:sugar phosphate permease
MSARFVSTTGSFILPLVLVEIERSLKISNADIGSISAMYGFLFIAGSISWGLLADKIGLRKSLMIGCLILSIGIIGMGTINSTIMGMLFYSLIGFSAAAPISLSALLNGAWFDRRRRGIAQSYMGSPQTLWMAMLGIAIPTIMLTYGWRNVWYIFGLLGLFLSGVGYVLIRNSPKEKGLPPCGTQLKKGTNMEEANHQTALQDGVRRRDIIKMGITWHLSAIFTLTVLVKTIPTIFVVAYLITEIKLKSIEAGLAFSIFTLAMMGGGYLWGFISDYVPRKYVVAICSILYAIALLALIVFGKELTLIYVIVAAMGFTIAISPVTFALIPDCFPLKVVGTASGLVNAISGVGFILGPLIAGNVATMTGSFIPAFQLTIVLAIVLAAVSIALSDHHN